MWTLVTATANQVAINPGCDYSNTSNYLLELLLEVFFKS